MDSQEYEQWVSDTPLDEIFGYHYIVTVHCLQWAKRGRNQTFGEWRAISGCGREFYYPMNFIKNTGQWQKLGEIRCPHCRTLMAP